LKVVYIVADEGHTLKRYRPQSRGRFSPILKRSTHIKVMVSEEGK
jgi:large subunit ribosomal protein L22